VEIPLGVRFLRYEHIREHAESFLRQYHPLDILPVPIEEIVEFKLGIDIIPIPELQKTFDVEGFTYCDLSSICVDQFVLESRPARYRFTLAHEVGHIVLHRDIYHSFSFDSIRAWKEFVTSVDEKDYGWLEWQAYSFAGLLLVPGAHLEKRFDEVLLDMHKDIRFAKEQGLSREDYLDYILQTLAERLSPAFDVSPQVIKKRIEKDDLVSRVP
jgi:hypothetical protein